jgi:CBS domain-containing protein
MKIKDIMTRNVEALRPEDTIQAAAQKMRDLNIGFLPVLEDGELIGVVTDRDLVVRAMADGIKSKAVIGRDIPTSPVVYCFDDQEIDQAADIMRERLIRRLVVLDGNTGDVVGVVSLGDLAAHTAPGITEPVLREISEKLIKAH